MRASLALLLLLLAAAGCNAEVHAELTADGTPFQVRTCKAGEPLGYFGIELLAFDGRRIRLATRPDGTGDALLFPPGAATGHALGPCGPFAYRRSNTEINHVRAVEGSATLSCKSGGHELSGTLTYEDCAG